MKYVYGEIIIRNDGSVTIQNGYFQYKGGSDPTSFSKADFVRAVRARCVEVLSDCPGLEPLRIDENKSHPITIQDERLAEMETYLLINRCQGNG